MLAKLDTTDEGGIGIPAKMAGSGTGMFSGDGIVNNGGAAGFGFVGVVPNRGTPAAAPAPKSELTDVAELGGGADGGVGLVVGGGAVGKIGDGTPIAIVAAAGGGGGIVPTTGDDIIGGTIGNTDVVGVAPIVVGFDPVGVSTSG